MKIIINQKFISIVLLLALLMLAFYIGYDKISGYVATRTYDAYSTGYRNGMEDAVNQFIEGSKNCNPVIIQDGNETRNFIEINCLIEPGGLTEPEI